jgi:hypothetical protein
MLPFVVPIVLFAGAGGSPTARVYPLSSTQGLDMKGTAVLSTAVYRGKPSVVVTEDLDPANGDTAVVKGADFHNGTIDFDVAGVLTANAPRGARSFVGIAFRGADDMGKYENFYLRMTNGRADDQEQRNHSVQYCSVPTYTWDVLRKQKPAKYETYADLELGGWTHVKIVVQGTEAKFFVGNVTQPTLIVHGLFMGDVHGKVALWVAGYTRAYFSNLKIQAS